MLVQRRAAQSCGGRCCHYLATHGPSQSFREQTVAQETDSIVEAHLLVGSRVELGLENDTLAQRQVFAPPGLGHLLPEENAVQDNGTHTLNFIGTPLEPLMLSFER